MPLHVTSIVGARPELIKVAAVSDAFADTDHTHRIVHTGQHYDRRMSQQFVDELHIPEPDVDLGIGSGPHGAQTGRMLAAGLRSFNRLMPEEHNRVLVDHSLLKFSPKTSPRNTVHGIAAMRYDAASSRSKLMRPRSWLTEIALAWACHR